MRALLKLGFVVFASLFLAGCSSNLPQSYAPLPPAAPTVTAYSQEQIDAHDCSVIYLCVVGYLTTSEACVAVEFEFNVLDHKNSAILVDGAKSYWGSVPSGVTEVEWGVNNGVTGSISYTPPVAKCLTETPNYQVARAVFDFPNGYCDGRPSAACSSVAMTGWELDQHASGGTNEPWGNGGGNGYTVICNDGWVSESGGLQGACSHHGGVSG
jgi:hypothetical protein